MSVTAKVVCQTKIKQYDGVTNLSFLPDYQDGRNAEWAAATPSLSLTMTVNDNAAEHFESGQAYTLVFEKNDE